MIVQVLMTMHDHFSQQEHLLYEIPINKIVFPIMNIFAGNVSLALTKTSLEVDNNSIMHEKRWYMLL